MNKPIIIEQAFDQPSERVWHAITEVDQMTLWFSKTYLPSSQGSRPKTISTAF